MLYTEEAINKRKNNAQLIKSIISTILYILLIPLLMYNISLIIQAVTNPTKTPNFFGIKTYVIVSGSMEPELNIGDIVIAKEVEADELQIGDIISFRQGQSIITHRIVAINQEDEKTTYTTKGDNNNTEDTNLVEINLIEGKMIKKVPKIGKISMLLKGKITLIVIALLIYIYYSHTSSIKIKKDLRKVKRLKYEENKKRGEGKNEQ